MSQRWTRHVNQLACAVARPNPWGCWIPGQTEREAIEAIGHDLVAVTSHHRSSIIIPIITIIIIIIINKIVIFIDVVVVVFKIIDVVVVLESGCSLTTHRHTK